MALLDVLVSPPDGVGNMALALRPEFADRHVADAGIRQIVDAQVPVGFDRQLHAVRPRQFPQPAGVVVADHLAHGRADIPQKPLGQLRAADHAARHDRQPGAQIIPSPRAELGGKCGRPVLAAGLPAIDMGIGQRPVRRPRPRRR